MQKKTEKNSRKTIVRDMILIICLSAVAGWMELYSRIPDRLTAASDENQEELLQNAFPDWMADAVVAVSQSQSDIPLQNLNVTTENEKEHSNTEKNSEGQSESYVVQCSLFGTIPIKNVSVDVVERECVIPCGMPVGVYIKTQGVLIVGTGEVCDINGERKNPGGDMVHSGDYILAVNGIPVSEKEEVVKQIQRAMDDCVTLTVLRDQNIVELQAPVVQTGENEYKAGIWIRDDTQGIGTLTYVTEDGEFGALGHGINDIDTSTLLSLEGGGIYETELCSVVKSINGMPGELCGSIDYEAQNKLGTILENSEIGIFGTMDGEWQKDYEKMEIAYKQEIKCQEAVILSEITGERKEYQIEIEKVDWNSSDENKGMVIHVTDPELLELTGGIVRGMSGSPILQDGKIVGAVTHVLVNDPTRGYGIFIENMLDATG